MYDHGNFDYDHGCIAPPGVNAWERFTSDPIRRQVVRDLWDRSNKYTYAKRRNITPYAALDLNRSHKASWCNDRNQNTSSVARRGYKRTANKHTRQMLDIETKEILEDI